MEFHARLEIDGVHDDVVVDVGGVHVSDHDALVALEMLRQLHAQLVRRCEVQRIIRCKRLHDVVVAAALRFAELLFTASNSGTAVRATQLTPLISCSTVFSRLVT